jgi:hypothetical protein
MQSGKKNDKNAMIKAYKDRNAELNNQNQELKSTVAALIKQRDEALALAKKRGDELALAWQELEVLKKQGLKVQVRKVAEDKPARVQIKTVPKYKTVVEEPRDRRPFGIRVQSAIAEFLKDWGRAPRDPQKISWDKAYHINGALLNGESRFTLDEIMTAVGWTQYTLDQGHSIAETREYLGRELPNLGRRGECELAFLDLAFPPEQQKTSDKEAEAVSA